MKKILLCLVMFLGIFSVVACSCNKDDDKDTKANLLIGDMNATSYKEITMLQLKSKIETDETFVLYVYTTCTACKAFKPVLDNYISEKHINVYAINDRDIDKDHELSVLETSPALVVYNKGEISYKIEYNGGHNEYFDTKEGLDTFFKTYTNLPTMYYISLQQLQSKIDNDEDFIIYYSRSSCGDCSYLNKNYLREYLNANYTSKHFYVIETDAEGIRYYNGAAPSSEENATEDEIAAAAQWQAFKDKYGLSNATNTLGHGVGYVPTFQYYEDGEIKDMMVYFNDGTYIENEDHTYSIRIDMSYYSDHPYLNQTLKYSEYKGKVEGFYNGKLKTFLDTNLAKVN